jgi:hypothetical protein
MLRDLYVNQEPSNQRVSSSIILSSYLNDVNSYYYIRFLILVVDTTSFSADIKQYKRFGGTDTLNPSNSISYANIGVNIRNTSLYTYISGVS